MNIALCLFILVCFAVMVFPAVAAVIARATAKREAVILALLRADAYTSGADLVRLSGGRLSRGTMYATLYDMETRGLVVGTGVLGVSLFPRGTVRRYYRLTDKGRAMVTR